MKGIPPEIDDLLWRLAEEGGPSARAEFESRHARYGPELARRVHMVAELRQAGRMVAHRPAFRPRPVRKAAAPRWAVGSALALGTFAVGTVAYVMASSGERPVALIPPRPVKTQPVEPPVVVYQEAPKTIVPKERPKIEEPKPNGTPKYLVKLDTHITDAPLASAISLVAAKGGLEVTVAPGFEDERVSFDYHDLDTIDTLKAMGEEHGFSVLEEQEGHVLVVPAREPSSDRRVGP